MVLYSYLARFLNTITLNMYIFMLYTGLTRAEYVIRMLVAASQERVNACSTYRL